MGDVAEEGRQDRSRKFARDVLVNVVANLIAAAIIYLLGAFVGLLPKNETAILGAVLVLLVATAMALIFAGIAHSVGLGGRWANRVAGTVVILLGLGLLSLAGSTFLGSSIEDVDVTPGLLVVVFLGCLLVFLGIKFWRK